MEGLDIYNYLDYRAFCRDFYTFHKKVTSGFSYRSFGRTAGIAAAYFKHIMDGKRNLSPEMSIKFAEGMKLTTKEIDYFENLVRFNQAHSLEEKSLYFERLRKKRARTLQTVSLAEAVNLLTHWHVVAIKELVVNKNTDDAAMIQQWLRKKIPETLVRDTIEKLKVLGWITFSEDRWKSSASQIQFPDEVKSYVIRSFHRQMLKLAMEALGDDISEREFGAMIFTFPVSCLPQLKEKVKELQKDLLHYIQDISTEANDSQKLVYHFGVQCFSLQKNEGFASLKNEGFASQKQGSAANERRAYG